MNIEHLTPNIERSMPVIRLDRLTAGFQYVHRRPLGRGDPDEAVSPSCHSHRNGARSEALALSNKGNRLSVKGLFWIPDFSGMTAEGWDAWMLESWKVAIGCQLSPALSHPSILASRLKLF